jgi:hypothetical protein
MISETQRAELIAAFDRLAQTDAESLFNEIAATPNEVSIENIKPERRAIDRIIMADILGLNDEEQLDVYRAVIDVIRSRLDKAGSDQCNYFAAAAGAGLFSHNTLTITHRPFHLARCR